MEYVSLSSNFILFVLLQWQYTQTNNKNYSSWPVTSPLLFRSCVFPHVLFYLSSYLKTNLFWRWNQSTHKENSKSNTTDIDMVYRNRAIKLNRFRLKAFLSPKILLEDLKTRFGLWKTSFEWKSRFWWLLSVGVVCFEESGWRFTGKRDERLDILFFFHSLRISQQCLLAFNREDR